MKGLVLAGIGIGIGVGVGYLIGKRPPTPSAEAETELVRLDFLDTVLNQYMTNRKVYDHYKTGDWEVWIIGYGLPDSNPDDIMVDLGFNRRDGSVGITVSKLGHNPVVVYLDGKAFRSLEKYDITLNVTFKGAATWWMKTPATLGGFLYE